MKHSCFVPVYWNECQAAVTILLIYIILKLHNVIFCAHLFTQIRNLKALTKAIFILFSYLLLNNLLCSTRIASIRCQKKIVVCTNCTICIQLYITVQTICKIFSMHIQQLQQLIIQLSLRCCLLTLYMIFIDIHVFICIIKQLLHCTSRKITCKCKAHCIA